MTQVAPPPEFLGSSDTLNYGVPATTQGQQFLLEEQAAAAARGSGDIFSGWSLPPSQAGDFWALYQMAETFAANTGWRYLPTPQLLTDMLSAGAASWNAGQVYSMFAQKMGLDTNKMPWAIAGLNSTDYLKATNNLNDMVYQLTGESDWSAAGIPGSITNAVIQGWSTAQLQDWIQRTMPGKYGYLKYGYNYNTFQNYKAQNQQALRERYGTQFSDAQAIENLGAPLPTFKAAGGAFGQAAPYVQSQSTLPTGFQSASR